MPDLLEPENLNRPTLRAELPPVDLPRTLPLGDLLALGAQFSAEISPDELLQEAADSIYTVLGYPQVCIRVRNPDTDALEACAFAGISTQATAQLRAQPIPPAEYQALLQPRYRFSESYLVPINKDRPHALVSLVAECVESDRILLVPLRGRGDRLTGVISVALPPDPQALALGNIQMLEVITRQAALALDNARLAARSARLLAKEQLLVELGRDVSTTLESDAILARTVGRLAGVFQSGAIALRNAHDELAIAVAFGDIDTEARNATLPIGEGICGWVAQNGLPFLTNDLDNELRIQSPLRDVGSNRTVRSYIAVPLRTGGGVIGTLNVRSDQLNAFTYEDVDLLEAVAAQISGPIASARLYQEAQRLAEQVKRRNEHLTVLNALARTSVSTLDLEWVLSSVTRQIHEGFGYGHVELYLVDEETGEAYVAAQAGLARSEELGYRQPLSRGLIGRAYRTAQTVRVDDVLLDQDYIVHSLKETRAELCVPIVASNRVLGLLNLESRRVAAFTEEDTAVLETVADVLASAIEKARLYQRAQEAAVLEERSRLARDLHDSVSQQLFSMTLTAQAARAQLAKNPARTADQLERIQETAAAALSEMRALIFQLRPPGLSEQGLIAALQQHVSALGRREGLTMNLNIDGDERYARGAEQAIYRIAQEALNNVIRHAGACSVDVELTLLPEALRLRICDDGCGFEPGNPNPGNGRHLGMTSMRERAAELGGTLEVRSQRGKGTEILMVMPGRSSRDVSARTS